MQIPLEDNFDDIISKAQKGLRISDRELIEKTNLSLNEISSVKSGNVNDAAIRKLAQTLNLDENSLIKIAHCQWSPKSIAIDCLEIYQTSFGDMNVNSYLIWDSNTKSAITFDTGTNASEMISSIESRDLIVKALFITHSHYDHIAALTRLHKSTKAPFYISQSEAIENAKLIDSGQKFLIDSLTIDTLDTCGHSSGGITYFIQGLSRPIAVVGDALFAGSMGGAATAYDQALEKNRKNIFTLPDNTIICPGHGPMTTVIEEKENNPFYPEFK